MVGMILLLFCSLFCYKPPPLTFSFDAHFSFDATTCLNIFFLFVSYPASSLSRLKGLHPSDEVPSATFNLRADCQTLPIPRHGLPTSAHASLPPPTIIMEAHFSQPDVVDQSTFLWGVFCK